MKSSPIPAEVLLAPDTKGLARATELLKAGKLIVLPTETVYGIAVNLHSPEARAKAKKLMEAVQPMPPWVVHVARYEDVLAWAPGLSTFGRRLIAKTLPGPVAFKIKLSEGDLAAARIRLGSAADETLHDGYITIRCPDFSHTQTILANVGSPVGVIGAGNSAQPAVFEVSELPESILATGDISGGSGLVEAIVDGGQTRYRRSSTLVKLDGEQFSVVRPGVIDERILQKMADFLILFICSGNTCRSPMAAALATRLLADKLDIKPSELPLRHIVVQSAGLHASRGIRATPEAIEAVETLGGDLGHHFSQPATIDLLRRADVVYTMTDAHREEVLEMLPTAAPKTHRLDPNADVEDPIGAGLPIYEEVAGRLIELLQHRLRELPL